MDKIKEYKVFKIRYQEKDTENYLNVLAMEGWRLICSYAYNNQYLIMERERK